jgi:SWI/SNF-related matrix-associated actin-dependent regulator 1 of chromatin subfamily A
MPLLEFQEKKGVPFILSRNRSYLAHQPGLGKSAQFITAVNSKPGKALITCPAFLKVNWAREITKWSMTDFPSIAIIPPSPKRETMNWSADYIVCPDSMIKVPWVVEGLSKIKFKYIGLDEAQRYKTPEASRTTALFGGRNGKLSSPGLIYEAEHVVALSGTPMLNRPIELWPIVYAMAPELIDFMPMQDFGFRYCGPWRDDMGHIHFTGSSNEAELKQRLTPFIQRIRKEQVLKDLPEKVREVIFIDKEIRSRELHNLDNHLLKKLSKSNVEVPKSLGEYAELRHAIGIAKAAWVADFAASYLEDDESIILYAHHRDVVATLAEYLFKFNPMVINGSTDQSDRTMYQDLFQSKKRRLIIGNISAMNLGLTLTAATRVVFAEYDWTPAMNEQAEDRAHRIGQHDSVFVQYIVLPNSLDERVLTRVLEKQERIGKVIG